MDFELMLEEKLGMPVNMCKKNDWEVRTFM